MNNERQRQTALRAGRAFLEQLEADPSKQRLLRALKRVQSRMTALAAVLAKADAASSERREQLVNDGCKEIAGILRRFDKQWEAEYGEPFPHSIPEIYKLAIRAGVPFELIGQSNMEFLFACIEGHLQGVRDKGDKVSVPKDPYPDDPGDREFCKAVENRKPGESKVDVYRRFASKNLGVFRDEAFRKECERLKGVWKRYQKRRQE